MPEVLHVITDDDARGAQTFGVQLVQALAARGTSGRLVALAPGPNGGGLDVEALGSTRLGAATLSRLRCEIRQAHVVVAHGSTTLPACVLAGWGTGMRLVYRSIGDPLYWANTPWRRRRVRLLLRAPHLVVALWPGSRTALHEQLGVGPERSVTIPNGVPAAGVTAVDDADRRDGRVRFGLLPDKPTILSIGALSPEKSIDTAIRAVASLPDSQLLVVGDGPQRQALERLAARLLPGRAHFAGVLADPSQAYAAADVLLMTSRSEGMPAVLVEAGLRGVPAVATDVGGVGEIVLDRRTGRVVPVEDVPATTEALAHVLDRRAQLGARAAEHCYTSFSMDVVAAAWDQALQITARLRAGA